ncbi:uncharacterized protein LOC129792575 [Lutzomyia longipalpis]|uniref:uncharacterized protein LOC129792575 n=1 Tax=Lutzomyia longipalpis TaxID=7200 RepID=UPI00248402E4|nr:uncharacterized protein LOC129792575 [Lutzomyia longipalpis]
MWISRILILIAVSVAATTDVQDEEAAESQRQARYAKNDRPLLLIRPVQTPPKAHSSAGSSLASTLSSLLPKFNFGWDFLGGDDKRPSPPTKVTYKIIPPPSTPHVHNIPPLSFKKEPTEPILSKAVPLSQLHTTFKADFDAMQKKKKYPAYNPKPTADFLALPLKRAEPEPIILSPRNVHTEAPPHVHLSDIIVGKPSSDGVNIPPHVEATLIENNQGIYHDLTGEIKFGDKKKDSSSWEWNQEHLQEKLEGKPLSEPYEFDFGGQDILIDSKPISLSPELLPKDHFKFNQDVEHDPDFYLASEDVINIVSPPSRSKNSLKHDKVSFAPADAINIVQPPTKKSRKDQRRKQNLKIESEIQTKNQVHFKEQPVFISSTPLPREFHQEDIDFIKYHHHLPIPEALRANIGNTYEVIEDTREDHKNPFLSNYHKHVKNIGEIEKYMEDAKKMYLSSNRNAKEALKYTIAIFPTTPKPLLKDFHRDVQKEEEIEIITEGFPPKDFELAVGKNYHTYHHSEKKPRVYQDREERYFSGTDKEEKNKINLDDIYETDEYFLPKREPVYNKFYSTPTTSFPPTSQTFHFRPSASISFGEEDGRIGHFESLENKKAPKASYKQDQELNKWPPKPTSSNDGISGYTKLFTHEHEEEKKPSLSYLPEFTKLNIQAKNATQHFSLNKHQQESTTETIDTVHNSNYNFFPGSNNYVPPIEHFPVKYDTKDHSKFTFETKDHSKFNLDTKDLSKFNLDTKDHSKFNLDTKDLSKFNFETKDHQSYAQQSDDDHFFLNHKYQPDEEQNIIPLTENYPKEEYKPINEEEEEFLPSSTPAVPKFTASHQEFKEGLKNRSPKPTFFIKITTTSPPFYRRPNPTSISCERRCIQTTVTQEYLPVCGSDGRTYSNRGKLTCANNCGKEDITVSHIGSCTPSK